MTQNLMERTLPAESAYRDAVMGTGLDKSTLILIKHCRDMKQQETYLRLITLLLVLSCTVLFCFTFSVAFKQNTGTGERKSPDEPSPAYSKQTQCPTDNAQTNLQRWHISLRSMHGDNKTDGQYIKWKFLFGEDSKEEDDIVIPRTGVYFVYVKTELHCHDVKETTNFYVEVQSWNKGYDKPQTRASALDGLVCPSGPFRTVVVGELLDLLEGDRVRVWVDEGYKLISKSFFGAFFV